MEKHKKSTKDEPPKEEVVHEGTCPICYKEVHNGKCDGCHKTTDMCLCLNVV